MVQRPRVAILLLVAAGCGGDVPARAAAGGAPADTSAGPSGGREIPASLILVEGRDEEGGSIGRVIPAESGAAFFRGDTVHADAERVTAFLDPDAAVEVVEGRLRVDGADTGIAVELRDAVAFAPLRALASRFHAYVRVERDPGRVATIWPMDVLCEYAADADRRAEVFVEAAEQGLLRRCDPPIEVRVRRWPDARPDEQWAASISFGERVPDSLVAVILDAHGLLPYGAYGWVGGGQRIERVPPASASPGLLSHLRARTIDELHASICGLPEAIGRRSDPPSIGPGRRSDPDRLDGERHLLAGIRAARVAREQLRDGAPLVYGVDAIGPAESLARLEGDPRVARVDPGTRVGDQWVVPGPDASALPGLAIPPDIARLDSTELRARLRAEGERAEAECPAPPGPRRGVP